MLQSVSRLIGEIVDPRGPRRPAQRLRSALAAYREKEDLISIGAYQRGTDPWSTRRSRCAPQIDAFLRQAVDEPCAVDEADRQLLGLAHELVRRLPIAGEVLDGPPAVPPAAVPGRQVPAGGVQVAAPAIPGLQLRA